MKVHLWPDFRGPDEGDGGVRRVVEAQQRHLPPHGVELVSAADAEIIACHITAPNAYSRLYPRTPLIAHCHGLYWAEYKWASWAVKANKEVMELLRIADAITAPSEWVAQVIRRHTSRPVTVIHHGVDADEWAPEELGVHPYVLWNKTRPDPVCDPLPVIEAAKRLPDVTFMTTFGVDDIPNPSNVLVTDRQPYDVAKRMVKGAGVYLATTKETFGIGTLEAMAAGVPVVGFNWGGQPDIIEHGVDGYLVPPGDYDALAEGIQWAIENRRRVGQAAIKKARTFTWEAAAERYVEVYEEVLERRRVHDDGPKVSVIVTAYNLEKYLPDTLRSVRAQTLENFECIIVDDASPDKCGEIADMMAKADPRFKVIHNPTNLYLAGARNAGIAQARGEYILPLDADDMIEPRTLEILAESLDKDPTFHIAYGNVLFVEEDGTTPSNYGTTHGPGHSGWPMPFDYEGQAKGLNFLPYCSMYRRRVWADTAGYRIRCRTAEDADFWVRVSSYGFRPRMVTDEDTLVYRNRPGSMSRKEGRVDWIRWFPWGADLKLAPAGADTREQLPIPSFDPPAVSVIIPVGPGHEQRVLTAIDTVDAQSFRGFECIVANDTGAPLPPLPPWVRVVDTGGRKGVGAARNAAIRVARSDYFLPLDADDLLEPDALDWLLTAAVAYPGEIIYCDFYEDPEKAGQFKVYETADFDPALLTRRGLMHPVTALTPVSAWVLAGGYDETAPCWEDWLFALAAIDHGVCSRRLRAPLFTYRKWTGARRETNQLDFDRCREAVLKRFGKFWDGGKNIMGCGCSRSPSESPAGASTFYSSGSKTPEGAVLVRYIGGKEGSLTYRGKTAMYEFSAFEPPKWVLAEDAQIFARRMDFEIVDHMTGEASAEGEPAGPTLVAHEPLVGEASEGVDSMHAGELLRAGTVAVASVEQAPDGPPVAVLERREPVSSAQAEADHHEASIAALMGAGFSRTRAEEMYRESRSQ